MGIVKKIVKGIGNIFDPPEPPKAPPAPTPPPKQQDPDVQKAAEEQRRMAARARGRASTILTSGLGVGRFGDDGEEEKKTRGKTLLGG